LSFVVAGRRREIDIRLAIGAQRPSIITLFIKDIIALVGIGVCLGIPLSVAVGRQFGSVLFGLEPSNVPTLLPRHRTPYSRVDFRCRRTGGHGSGRAITSSPR